MNDITPETQAVIDGIKITVLQEEVDKLTSEVLHWKGMTKGRESEIDQRLDEIEKLKDGGCRFNCRTEKEAYIAGYEERDRILNCVFDAAESYKEWKKGERLYKFGWEGKKNE